MSMPDKEQLTVRVTQTFLGEIDDEADRRNQNRSDFVRQTLRNEIKNAPERDLYSAIARGLAVVEIIAFVLVLLPLVPTYLLTSLPSSQIIYLTIVPAYVGGTLFVLVFGSAVALVSYYGASRSVSGSRAVSVVRRLLR